ncbi:cyclin like [Micractinium conductrix]|uniref:Cyclin like n=1 Tax=Micractinium conductrix TaxID=554055 RepID=A0A2P6V555_9CHLO|nr:cyclin like [Micractinium conductrix]|eukprot:PSC69230.1 cyclin like [Micractinium conductrix]
MAADAELAVDACDGRLASRSALASVMDSAGRALPHKSRQALLRRYKQSAMQLRRRERRSGGGEGWDSEEGSEAPAAFDALPADVIALVFMWGWAAVAPLFMWGEFAPRSTDSGPCGMREPRVARRSGRRGAVAGAGGPAAAVAAATAVAVMAVAKMSWASDCVFGS